MQNSKALFAERTKLADSQAALVAEGKENEALIVEGQIKQLDITLEHVLDEEEKLRQRTKTAPAAKITLAEAILGSRDEFDGIEVGFKASTDAVRNETSGDPSVVTVAAPMEIELDIPGKSVSLLNNFAATLPSEPAQGSVSYKQRSTQHGAPGTWDGVVDGSSATKEKVIYTWKDAVANKETIAGYVPISKDTLRDYNELASIIQSDLLIDLHEKENAKYLNGNNPSGIVGVLNTVGILDYAVAMGGIYYDAIRYMRTKVMKEARRIPTHVTLHPDIKTAIDLYKTSTGLYQYLGDDTYWGMKSVEDFDCGGILVYDAYAALKRPIHGLTVEVGYVNDQFIKNELCLLAEETSALQTRYPDAFCFASIENLNKATA